jgi:ABC-2 type transport system permease protein
MSLVVILLRARLRMVINTAFRQSRERRGRTLIFGVLILGAVVALYRLADVIFAVDAPTVGQQTEVVTGALTLLAGFVGVTSITFALSSLYFAKDLDTLLATPLPPRAVILSRMYSQLALGLVLGALFAGPPLIAYLNSLGKLWTLPLVAVTILSFAVLPMALATVVTIVALRLVPARYVRDSGGLVVTVAVFMVAAVNLVVRGTQAFTSAHVSALPFDKIGQGAAGGALSPAHWGAASIVAATQGNFESAIGWALPLIGLGVVIPPLFSRLAEDAYLSGYQRNATASRGNVGHGARSQRKRRMRAAPIWLLLAGKDLRQIRRDPSQIGQLALPLVLFALYLGTPGRAPTGGGTLPSWFFVALTSTFASLLFAANIALRGVGIEGQKMWVLRVCPFDPRQLLASKYASGFVVAAIPAAALFFVGEWTVHASLVQLILPLLRVAVLIATIVGIAVGLGSIRPRLDWTDPRRAVGIGTTLGYLALGACYLTGSFILLGLPYAFGNGTPLAVALCDVALLTASMTIVGGMSWLASLRLQRMEL